MYDFLNTITFLTVYWMCEAHLVNFAMKFKLGDWLFFRDFCNSSVCKWFDVLVLTILCSCMANWLSIAIVKLKVQINPKMFLFWGGRVSSTIYAKRLKPCFRPIVPPCWQMQRKCKFPALSVAFVIPPYATMSFMTYLFCILSICLSETTTI